MMKRLNLFGQTLLAFHPSQPHFLSINLVPTTTIRPGESSFQRQKTSSLNAVSFDEVDRTLSLWILSFASSHIGMSALRTELISSLGCTMDSLQLVGNEEWRLPSWWPGDNTGGNRIFPDDLTAGRQVYRALYTAVSFITLGSAFGAYLTSSEMHGHLLLDQSQPIYNAFQLTASLSFGSAIASLFNASPLGLMPSFERADGDSTILLRRNDSNKFTTSGLTRITRHPLILPVVPWGVATAYLAGNRPCDYILFGGLALYAILGCYAQDLRVIREEGSVGTVFQTEAREKESEEKSQLRSFFSET